MSGFVCVHIRQSNLCLSHVYMDLCCGDCYFTACSLFLSMCLFVLVSCLLNAFPICGGEVTILSVRIIVLVL